MPTSRLSRLSTTTRRTWFSLISRAASLTSWSSKQYRMSGVVASPTRVVLGSEPSATARTTMSRSVSIPTSRSFTCMVHLLVARPPAGERSCKSIGQRTCRSRARARSSPLGLAPAWELPVTSHAARELAQHQRAVLCKREGASMAEDFSSVDAIVEIPRGSRNKYECNPATGAIRLDRVLFSSMHYPGDYGFIPGTRCGDGDPLDVLIRVEEPTFPGCRVLHRAILVL